MIMQGLELQQEIKVLKTPYRRSYDKDKLFEMIFVIFMLFAFSLVFFGYYKGAEVFSAHHFLKLTKIFLISLYMSVFLSIIFGIILIVSMNLLMKPFEKNIHKV